MAKFIDSMRRQKGSIYSLVARYYVLFAIAILILASGVVYFTRKAIYDVEFLNDSKVITSQMTDLENEHYDRINLDKIAGKDGYFEILDDNAKVIFASKEDVKNEYLKEELDYIPSISGNLYYYAETLYKDNAISGYILNRYTFVKRSDEDKNNSLYGITGISILDKDGNVVYSNFDGDSKLSKNELNYAMGANLDGLYLQRFLFTTVNGAERTLLLHSSYTSTGVTDEKKIYTTAVFIFLTIFALLLISVVLRTIMAVKKPMTMLEDAMEKLTSGKRDVEISYSGPKEIVEIVDAFNDMSDKLYDIEHEREHLENERQKILTYTSYDIAIPMMVIKRYASAAMGDGVSGKEKDEFLNAILHHADNLADLINSLGDYTKSELTEYELDRSNDDLCEFFKDYIMQKKDEIKLIDYCLEVDIKEEGLYKSFDKIQLRRAFENIVANLIRFNSSETKLYADMEVVSNKAIIHIGDEGRGIPENIAGMIFEPVIYDQLAFSDERRAGLGLSLAKMIIEAHGGSIRLMDQNETEYGTMFEIII